MPIPHEETEKGETLYLAGERVPPGHYRQVDGLHNIRLEQEDHLPAALDGHATAYVRVSDWKKQGLVLAAEVAYRQGNNL